MLISTSNEKMVRVTKELTGAWEVWLYTVPADLTTYEDIENFEGSLVDSGFEYETITAVEEVTG